MQLCVNKKIREGATVKQTVTKIFLLLQMSYPLAAKETKYHSSYYNDFARLGKQLAQNNDPIKTNLLRPIAKELIEKFDGKIIYLGEVNTK